MTDSTLHARLVRLLRAHQLLDNGYCRCGKDCLAAMDTSKEWREHLATLAVEQARQVIDEATAQEGDWSPQRRIHFATVIAALGEVKRG